MKHIESAWQGYKDAVLPRDATTLQVHECRQAFFSGAAILFTAMTTALFDESEEPTEADMKKMEEIQTEIDEFGAELDKRALNPSEH